MNGISIYIDSRKLAIMLMGSFAILLGLHTVSTYLFIVRDAGYAHLLWSWTYFDFEGNLPTLYSITLLYIASILCFLVITSGTIRNERALGWQIVGIAFFIAALDEYLTIHEAIDGILRAHISATGPLHYMWIVPYTAICGVVGLCLLPWYWKLAPRLRMLLTLSALLYAGGALGMEVVGGSIMSAKGAPGVENWRVPEFVFAITLEESMEMLGVSLFIYALFSHITAGEKQLRIRLKAVGKRSMPQEP